MTELRNRVDAGTVDELLGMAYDAYAQARLSPDPAAKKKLMQAADRHLEQAKDMRRRRNPCDRFYGT